MNIGIFLLSSTLLASSTLVTGSSNFEVHGRCNGSVTGTVTYEDGKIFRIEVNGSRTDVSSTFVAQFNFASRASFTSQEFYAGKNGIIVQDDGHRILLFPGGYSNQRVVHIYNYTDGSTSTVNVYCQPLSVAYRPGYQRVDDAIVGHCAFNATSMCIPYFRLSVRNGKWTDTSRDGFCSMRLATANHTNPVILQYKSDYDASVTKLYFASGKILYGIDLGYQDVYSYDGLPNGIQVHHLVLAVNSSFSGLRVTFSTGNDVGYYHQYFSSELYYFLGIKFHTQHVAFNSYDLTYLVTFANLNTLQIMREGRMSEQFPLSITLDEPIQCGNMAAVPNNHYLICLAGGGFHPVIINITDEQVTSKDIPVFNSRITSVGIITENMFYLLTEDQEMFFYVVNSVINYLGRYALRYGVTHVITSTTGDINCSDPDDINTARDGPQLSVTFVIIFGIVFTLLLLLLLIGAILRAIIHRARLSSTTALQRVNIKKELPHNDQERTTHFDLDSNIIAPDDHSSAATNTFSMEIYSSRTSISTRSFTIERIPDGNNGQSVTEGTTNDSDTEIEPIVQPQTYIRPFVSSAKSCNNEILKCGSNPSVKFVGTTPVIPIQTTSV